MKRLRQGKLPRPERDTRWPDGSDGPPPRRRRASANADSASPSLAIAGKSELRNSSTTTERRGPPSPASEPPAQAKRQECAKKKNEDEEEVALADLLELEECGLKVQRRGSARRVLAEASTNAAAASAKAAVTVSALGPSVNLPIEVLEDLLGLHAAGRHVEWPRGHDPTSARKAAAAAKGSGLGNQPVPHASASRS